MFKMIAKKFIVKQLNSKFLNYNFDGVILYVNPEKEIKKKRIK